MYQKQNALNDLMQLAKFIINNKSFLIKSSA